MRTKIIAIAGAVAVLVLGAGAVLVDAASNNTPPPRQTTTNEITVNPAEHTTQNPLVNPSAAGTQMGWGGYGASSRAMGEPSGNTRDGSVTPGAGQVSAPASVSPGAANIQTERQAYRRLSQLGFSRIAKLRQANDGWVAFARKGSREVTVEIDNQGNLVAER
jgi:hypothetical protein